MNRPAKVTQGEIARPRLRFLHKEKTRHGKIVWYVRRDGCQRVRVLGEPGTGAFMASYKAIIAGATPDPPMPAKPPRNQQGFVYFLRVGDMIKIGFSTDPTSRVTTLKTGLPGPIRMFLAVPGSRQIERILHGQLAEFRVSGEWFQAAPAVIKAMVRFATVGKVRLK